MAKKSNETSTESASKQVNTRREELRGQKMDAENKKLLRVVYAVAGLIGLVLIFALVNELLISPSRAVSTVAGENISLSEWKDRVGYERTQRIVFLESQYEAFDGDVGIIQQFAGQSITELQDAATLGENTLGQMTFELAACQELAATGVTISDADVQAEIETTFNYFGEDTESEEGDAPVSITKEEFDEQYDDLMSSLGEYGVSEEMYHTVIGSRLCQVLLMESLADEADISTEADHVNIQVLVFDNEVEAAQAEADIADAGFLSVWDAINAAANAETPVSSSIATDLTWRTQAEYEAIFGPITTAAIFALPLNESSGVIVDAADPTSPRYYIIMADGHEVRPLPESAIVEVQQQLLVDHVNAYLEINEEESNFWRNRIPTQPLLDAKFLAQPTPAPESPIEVETEVDPSE